MGQKPLGFKSVAYSGEVAMLDGQFDLVVDWQSWSGGFGKHFGPLSLTHRPLKIWLIIGKWPDVDVCWHTPSLKSMNCSRLGRVWHRKWLALNTARACMLLGFCCQLPLMWLLWQAMFFLEIMPLLKMLLKVLFWNHIKSLGLFGLLVSSPTKWK